MLLFATIAALFLSDASLYGHNLIGGEPVNPTDLVARTTVAIARQRSDDPRNGVEAQCSASLISNRFAITAAHCVKGSSGLRIVFETNTWIEQPRSAAIAAYAISPHYRDEYSKRTPIPRDNGDIALLRFEGGLPQGYEGARLIPSDYELKDGEVILLSGYGKSQRGDVPGDRIGLLRKGLARVKDAHYARTEISIEANPKWGAQNAGGDSGSPVFAIIDDKPYIFGVCNWGRNDQFSVFALVRAHLDWLRKAAESL